MKYYRVGHVPHGQTGIFPRVDFSANAFQMAEIAAKAVMDEHRQLPAGAWQVAYGSAGTVGAVGDVLAAAGCAAGTVSREDFRLAAEQAHQCPSAAQFAWLACAMTGTPSSAGV